MENSFVNAKTATNKQFKGIFSKEVQPFLEMIPVDLDKYFYEQKDNFFKKENYMSDERRKILVRRGTAKIVNEVEVLPPEPAFIKEKTFKEFSAMYEDDQFNQQELELIYLRGYLNMNFVDVAKSLKISKAKARQMGKDLEKEIANVRLERNVEIRQECGATKQHIETAKSLLVGKAIKALEKKLANEAQGLDDLPIERLIKIISDHSTGLEVSSSTYTGRDKPFMPDLIEAETLTEEY